MTGSGIGRLAAGQAAELTKTFTQADIDAFAAVTGDRNPLHVDGPAAAGGIFGGPVAHGMLVAGLVSAVIGTQLPGPGTIYLRQTLKFNRPVRPGDTVTARVEVVSVDPVRNRATLRTVGTNQAGEVVLAGEALVKPPDR